MLTDKDLKMNKIYWAEITDQELGEFYGKQLKVKFTGIVFRNTAYLKKEIGDFVNDPKEAVRHRLMVKNTSARLEL